LYIGATRAQAYKNSWPRRTLEKAAGRAGLLLFPYTPNTYDFAPRARVGKQLVPLLSSAGGLLLQQSIAAQAAHSPVAVAVFVCVSCPPICTIIIIILTSVFAFKKMNVHA